MRKVFSLFIIMIVSSLVFGQETTDDLTKEQKQEEQTTDPLNQDDTDEQENSVDENQESENVDDNEKNEASETDIENTESEDCDEQEKNNQKITLIGKLTKTRPLTLKKPSEYALEDGFLYKSTDYYIGDLNVYSENSFDISDLADKIVIAHGHVEQDLNKILTLIGECPENYGKQESMMQIRNDWVSEETGFSVGWSSIEKLEKVSFFNYDRVKECRMFRLKKYTDTKKAEIVFQNTLGKSISNITLVAHYESVFGKPVPMTQDKIFSHLAPGEKASFVVPVTISSIKKYELQSVKVIADNETIKIDIEEYYH